MGHRNYQGVQLTPVENEYFDVKLDPSIMLLEPTFPTISDDWVHKIQINVTAKKNVPVGKYKLGFIVETPSAEMQKEFIWQVLDRELQVNPEYKANCSQDVAERKISKDCETIFLQRQNKYVSGGTWNIAELTYSIEVSVVE